MGHGVAAELPQALVALGGLVGEADQELIGVEGLGIDHDVPAQLGEAADGQHDGLQQLEVEIQSCTVRA